MLCVCVYVCVLLLRRNAVCECACAYSMGYMSALLAEDSRTLTATIELKD